jgi:N-methylhydantoinase A
MTVLDEARIDDVEFLVHGTTIVINALTERTGALTALITTSGFRDVLEITRANRATSSSARAIRTRAR